MNCRNLYSDMVNDVGWVVYVWDKFILRRKVRIDEERKFDKPLSLLKGVYEVEYGLQTKQTPWP